MRKHSVRGPGLALVATAIWASPAAAQDPLIGCFGGCASPAPQPLFYDAVPKPPLLPVCAPVQETHGRRVKCGFINRAGRLAIDLHYDDVRGFSRGLAAVKLDDRHEGTIAADGKVTMDTRFRIDWSKDLAKGDLVAWIGPGWGLIDEQGRILLKPSPEVRSLTPATSHGGAVELQNEGGNDKRWMRYELDTSKGNEAGLRLEQLRLELGPSFTRRDGKQVEARDYRDAGSGTDRLLIAENGLVWADSRPYDLQGNRVMRDTRFEHARIVGARPGFSDGLVGIELEGHTCARWKAAEERRTELEAQDQAKQDRLDALNARRAAQEAKKREEREKAQQARLAKMTPEQREKWQARQRQAERARQERGKARAEKLKEKQQRADEALRRQAASNKRRAETSIYHESDEWRSCLETGYVSYKWGFMDRGGQIAVWPKYEQVGDFAPGVGLAIVGVRSGPSIQSPRVWGFIDKSGKTIIKPQFGAAKSFSLASGQALAPVKVGEAWGFIDTEGRYAIPPRFQDAEPFQANGLARVQVAGKWGAIDTKGHLVIPATHAGIAPFSQALAAFTDDGKAIGYLDEAGHVAIPPAPDIHSAGPFGPDGIAGINARHKGTSDRNRYARDYIYTQYIDREGKRLFSPP